MAYASSVSGRPLAVARNSEAQIYGLFTVAMGLTFVGIILGIQFAPVLLGTGINIVFLIAQLILIFSASLWVDRTPLNYLLFGFFPLLSGITLTPYILYVLAGYTNGGTILLNACASTVFMAAGAAVFARTTSWDLQMFSGALLFGLLGLICLGILQIFVPAFRSTQMELLISGAGVVFFAMFIAFDVQRIKAYGKVGASPFMIALSLYLDIFNMFLYILRFMLAMYGDRR